MGAFDEERGAVVDAIASLYSRGIIGEDSMNGALDRITQVRDSTELARALEALPEIAKSPEFFLLSAAEAPPQLVSGDSSTIKKSGAWLSSRRLEIRGSSSSFRLDLGEYAGKGSLRLEILLSLRSCSLKLILPADFELRSEIESQTSSTVHVGRRRREGGSSIILLRGEIVSSSIKVKYRR